MRVKIIAADSFSTRSLATVVYYNGYKIFIDPSISIGPKRYNLPPHPIELEELKKGKQRILEELKDTDIVFITHYHYDHVPFPNSELMKALQDKVIYAKNYKNMNFSQRKRGYVFEKEAKNLAKELYFIDEYRFEDLDIETFLGWHGEKNSKFNKVLIIRIGDFIFASDIQCLDIEAAKKITEFKPNLVIASGPPMYFPEYKKKLNVINKVLDILSENSEKVILDHHLLRDLNYRKYWRDNFITAAEFMGYEIKQLEANRKRLYLAKNSNNNSPSPWTIKFHKE